MLSKRLKGRAKGCEEHHALGAHVPTSSQMDGTIEKPARQSLSTLTQDLLPSDVCYIYCFPEPINASWGRDATSS